MVITKIQEVTAAQVHERRRREEKRREARCYGQVEKVTQSTNASQQEVSLKIYSARRGEGHEGRYKSMVTPRQSPVGKNLAGGNAENINWKMSVHHVSTMGCTLM